MAERGSVLSIPDGFLHVCQRGHVTAPGWMGQKSNPMRAVLMAAACPRAEPADVRGRHILCSESLVLLILYPEMLAAHKLGGEDAVAEMLSGLNVEWPPKLEAIPWEVTILD